MPYNECRRIGMPGCTMVATETLEAATNGLVIDCADLCRQCKTSVLDGWNAMKADERALVDKGLPIAEISNILIQRIHDGVYGE